MSNTIWSLVNCGLKRQVSELKYEHLSVLLSLWDTGHNALTKEPQKILVKVAFDKSSIFKVDDIPVKELFN